MIQTNYLHNKPVLDAHYTLYLIFAKLKATKINYPPAIVWKFEELDRILQYKIGRNS